MEKTKLKKEKRNTRHRRIRAKIKGTKERPRLSFFRSNTAFYAQIIDDDAGHTIAAVSSRLDRRKASTLQATEMGKALAEKAKAAKVTKVVFDRGGFLYTGNIKMFADGAKEGGLIF